MVVKVSVQLSPSSSSSMSTPKEMEFTEHLTGGGDVDGEIGGDIFIPMESGKLEDEGTLDEPVTTTLVRV